MDFVKQNSPNEADPGSNHDTGHGSRNLKHQRSGLAEEDIWKNSKMLRATTEVDFNFKKGSDDFERSNLWVPSGFDDGQKMLSFSSSETRSGGGIIGSRSLAFSISQDEVYSRAGGGFSEVMGSPFARLKGPFTPSQWMELEVQALIYKHFVANVPVPSNLLLPLKRSLYSYGPTASYPTNFLGWGPFHLGYSGSNDPEPGRCRRTDGKKWRCSRDAVPDQKYCERHINRGRHRSRKPVEGQTGHAVSGIGSTKTTTNTTTKVEPQIAHPSSASVISSSLGALQNQFNHSSQHNTSSSYSDDLVSRTQGFQGHTFAPSSDLKSKDDIPFAIPKAPLRESPYSMFGLVTSDALVNPSEKISYMNTRNPVRHFIDDWPNDQSNQASGPWPEELKSDWTQLSMSIPDFSSSSSPAQEKSSVPALKLSHEIDPIHMSLGVNPNWLPVSWGSSSMGGPLGEVLTSTGGGTGKGLSSSKAWNSSPQLGSSPTGVLQKSTFVTLSNNSSSGSSPTRDDKFGIGPSLVSSKAVPSL